MEEKPNMYFAFGTVFWKVVTLCSLITPSLFCFFFVFAFYFILYSDSSIKLVTPVNKQNSSCCWVFFCCFCFCRFLFSASQFFSLSFDFFKSTNNTTRAAAATAVSRSSTKIGIPGQFRIGCFDLISLNVFNIYENLLAFISDCSLIERSKSKSKNKLRWNEYLGLKKAKNVVQ